ncbi:glycoside hydrolase family 6 protein [Nocardioides sp. URHA0032]|uniref:glycoside hydrolase family 6 protein n=1 Tax=Nocardioides sp. URHA0032 TaxID=1380388 RepID=UPI000B2858A6|nr:glycoside hydrolase family 6 protein [Nocardioides sp. URHA0032]
MPLHLRRLAAGLLSCALLAGCDGGGSEGQPADTRDPQSVNRYADAAGYADPDSPAAQAAARAKKDGETEAEAVFERLATTPSSIWLTPEQYPAGQLGAFVSHVVEVAADAGQVPTFVVYGIPDRDCTGGFSQGGLPADDYGPWVQEIADAAAAGPSVVVVEPDAVASSLECAHREERIRLIADAVTRFDDAGVTTYVDGGHSNWVDPDKLAPLLEQVGVEDVRGFASNVSNYQSDSDERKYDEKLSGLLNGAHYVIDTGRNGNGSTESWCNPSDRAYGTDPAAAPAGDAAHLDAYVWVKPPGESDGECGGGPPAGEFWPERALAMAASSGW